MGQPKFFVVARKGFGPEQSIPAHLTSNARVRAAYGFDDHPRDTRSICVVTSADTARARLGMEHDGMAIYEVRPSVPMMRLRDDDASGQHYAVDTVTVIRAVRA